MFYQFLYKEFLSFNKKRTPYKSYKICAEQYTKFNKQEIDTLLHTFQTMVTYENRILTKKSNIDNFDIAIDSFQGAEICDLIGLYIPSEISPIRGPLIKHKII